MDTPKTGIRTNRHGDSEFIVKLQRPIGGPGLWRCYDQSRNVDTLLSCDVEGMDAAGRLMQQAGIGGGLKAYYYAKRVGANIWIFVDKLAPLQTW